ncbi:hypothetical protein LZ496_09180 [Sphingomonas sp. NSE70-1]|uniref:Lipoprotein n=1 Tax=Sphingomonas caseinilyticus TaxID=2908205 RepID=A0ABT0RVA3_9SPHN|nr:hypothetical protein [Sphingomonas caseinilyticus]MCL6698952.1 hypothetical protein [Sphingomonas caseinilyticus]
MTRKLVILPMFLIAACNAPNAPSAENANAHDESAAGSASSNTPEEANANSAMPPFAEVDGAHPTAPEPAPIPAKFRGTWAESKAGCADLADHSRLTISGRTVRHPDFVIVGESFSTPATNEFALSGKIEATGAPAEAHYSINPAGDVLTDGAGGGYIRVRCG